MDINSRDIYGTPVHYAIKTGQTDLLTYLLSRGADPNAETNEGLTPLALATQCNRPDYEDLLHSLDAQAG